LAAPLKPQKVTANGKDTWWFVPAIADLSEPTVAEINAASGLNATCYLLAEQDGITSTTEKVALARLLCETTTTEGLGDTTFSMSDVQVVFDPQAASGSTGKEAWDLMSSGFKGYAVRRQGVRALDDGDVAVGQFVDVVPVEVAPLTPGKSSTDASGIYTASAAVAVTATPSFNVPVVAS